MHILSNILLVIMRQIISLISISLTTTLVISVEFFT